MLYTNAPARGRLLSEDDRRPLVELSVEEIRARIQARYRQFRALPEVRRLQARRANWCIEGVVCGGVCHTPRAAGA